MKTTAPDLHGCKSSKLKIFLVGFFGALVLRLVNLTLRWDSVGLSGDERWWADKKPCIILLWHGRQLFMPWIYLRHRSSRKGPAMTVLISQHDDGRMVAAGMHYLGVGSIPGSSSRGGLRAIFKLIEKLKSNSHVAITPDGPRGPANKMKNGVLIIAQRSGAAIYPSAFSAEKFWKFKSWDGMIFPKPFSRAVIVKGSAITVPSDATPAELETLSQSLEEALQEVTSRADNFFGPQPERVEQRQLAV